MSKTIQIPVHMPLTLPDNWQDCTTAQQLAYWILAEFEEFKAGQATKEEVAELSNAINQLSYTVENKLDKKTPSDDGTYVYTVSMSLDKVVQNIAKTSDTPAADNIVKYGSNGRLRTAMPAASNDATNKGYVDGEVKEVSDACHANTVAIGNINTTISGINGNITEMKTDIGELQAEIANVPKWVNNTSNVVSSSAMFQTVTAANNKVTVSDSLFTSTGHTMFIMVKGITADVTNGKVFEKTGAAVNYDSNVREIDVVSVPQNPVFIINCFTYSGQKILNVSTLSAFV